MQTDPPPTRAHASVPAFPVAALIAAPAAVLGSMVLVRVVFACYDTDMHTTASVNFILWPVITPMLWLLESAMLAAVLAASARLARTTWPVLIGVLVLQAVGVLSLATWAYLHIMLGLVDEPSMCG